MHSFQRYYQENIEEKAQKSLLRHLTATERYSDMKLCREGQDYISFSCNDYLGLSHHPQVKQAAMEAIEQYGVGAGASRLITGNHPYYHEVETQLATMKQTESAVLFGSGYLTNIGIIPILVGPGDLIIADKLIHACLLDGAKLSGAKIQRFHHNDIESCERLLKQHRESYKRCIIISESVFSMDGDLAPIDALLILAKNYDGELVIDDAHGLAIYDMPTKEERLIYLGTLSKAAGSYGGYVCGSKLFCEYIINNARTLQFSTALPPMVVAATHAALTLMEENPSLGKKALAHAKDFSNELGLAEAQSAIVPLLVGSSTQVLAASDYLAEHGFLVSAIRPPTVPTGSARLRFTFSASHREQDIVRLVNTVKYSSFFKSNLL